MTREEGVRGENVKKEKGKWKLYICERKDRRVTGRLLGPWPGRALVLGGRGYRMLKVAFNGA